MPQLGRQIVLYRLLRHFVSGSAGYQPAELLGLMFAAGLFVLLAERRLVLLGLWHCWQCLSYCQVVRNDCQFRYHERLVFSVSSVHLSGGL